MTGIDLDRIREAGEFLGGAVHRTPLVGSRTLRDATGADVRLKLESFQKTGSFKPRGALFRISRLDPGERRRGVVTLSAGNHAQAAAFGCALQSVACTVVMPANAPPVKIEAVRGYGAEVVLHDDMRTLFERCERERRARDAAFLHPFDDPDVIAGHGTVGLEICEDFPEVDTVLCGVGGGGLISGVAAAVKGLRPGARIFGVEPAGAPTMTRALEAGEPVPLSAIATIADGLAAPVAGVRTLASVRELVEGIVRVSDAEILDAMRMLMSRCKLVVEPAGAAALAALLTGKVDARGRHVAVIVSGGNVDLDRLREWLAGPPTR